MYNFYNSADLSAKQKEAVLTVKNNFKTFLLFSEVKKSAPVKAMLLILIASVLLFSGCSKKDSNVLYIYNWSDYIDEKLVEEFTEKTGIKVISDYFDSNESMYAKLKAGASGYDIVFPTSYMVEIMNKSGMILDMDHSKIPNIKNIDSKFTALSPDSGMKYSIPYMISTTGIGYLDSKTDQEELSWDIFADPRFKGRMTMLNDVRETVGAALKYLGYSYNSVDTKELEEAGDLLIKWKKNLAKFENDQYKNGLVSGEFYISQGYSGDILQVQEENEDILFAVPKEGTSISVDNMVILKDSENVENAYKFINYLLEGEVAARNIEYVYYLAPNTEAYKLLSSEILEDPAVFITDEVINGSEILLDQGDNNILYSRVWDRVKAASAE